MPSSCAKQPYENCSPPACKWAGGTKRRFCRSAKNTSGSRGSSPKGSPKGSPKNRRGSSSCAKLSASQCSPPACKWASGGRRQFCRSAQNARRTPSPTGSNVSMFSMSSMPSRHPGPVPKHLQGGMKKLARKSSAKPTSGRKKLARKGSTQVVPWTYYDSSLATVLEPPMNAGDWPSAYAQWRHDKKLGPPGPMIGNLPAAFIEELDRRRRRRR